MFCPNCGSSVNPGETFCPMCGTAVEGSAQAEPEVIKENPVKPETPKPAPAPAPTPAPEKTEKVKKDKPLRDPPGLWNNVGLKIKVLSKILAVISMALSIILGVGCIVAGVMAADESFAIDFGSTSLEVAFGGLPMIIAGVVIIIVGVLAAWISSWTIYAYGDIADKLNSIEKNTRK